MTPDAMVRKIIADVEAAKAAMEDCPAGLILHTPAFVGFVCMKDGKPYLGSPTDDHVAVFQTFARADTLKRYWNSQNVHDEHRIVTIWPRREAMQIYINRMEAAVDVFLTHIERQSQ